MTDKPLSENRLARTLCGGNVLLVHQDATHILQDAIESGRPSNADMLRMLSRLSQHVTNAMAALSAEIEVDAECGK